MTALADELERLSQALALNEGFQLIVLECHDLDSWDLYRIFDVVQIRVAELRGTPPLVLIYDPYITTDETGSLRDEAWVEGVLQPIGELPRPTAEGASLVVVIDGTHFAATDQGELSSWRHLFRRMNEQRNALARTFAGTLALALPPDLVRVFIDEAPDSASLRSGHFQLDPSLLRIIRGPHRPRRPPDLSAYPASAQLKAALRRTAAEGGLARREVRQVLSAATAKPSEPAVAPALPSLSAASTSAPPQQALARLLLSLFSVDELRRHLHYQPDGNLLAEALPSASTSASTFVDAAVDVLDRRGMLSDRDFWDRLSLERPRRRSDIESVQTLFLPKSRSDSLFGSASNANAEKLSVLLAALDAPSSSELRQEWDLLRDLAERNHTPLHFVLPYVTKPHDLYDALSWHRPRILVLLAHTPVESHVQLNLARTFSRLPGVPQILIVRAPRAYELASELSDAVQHTIAINAELPRWALAALLSQQDLGRNVERTVASLSRLFRDSPSKYFSQFSSP